MPWQICKKLGQDFMRISRFKKLQHFFVPLFPLDSLKKTATSRHTLKYNCIGSLSSLSLANFTSSLNFQSSFVFYNRTDKHNLPEIMLNFNFKLI